jgi:hypothetical protein
MGLRTGTFIRCQLVLLAMAAPALAGLGVRGGVNCGFISAEGISPQTRPALVAGLTYVVPVVEMAGLQFELDYCRHQMRFDDSTQSYALRMDYLRLPGMVRVFLTGEDIMLRPFVLGGGELGIRVDQRFEVDGRNEVIEDIYPFDLDVFLGLGAELAGHMTVDLRLYRSAISIVNKDESGDIRNLGLALSAGLNF